MRNLVDSWQERLQLISVIVSLNGGGISMSNELLRQHSSLQ